MIPYFYTSRRNDANSISLRITIRRSKIEKVQWICQQSLHCARINVAGTRCVNLIIKSRPGKLGILHVVDKIRNAMIQRYPLKKNDPSQEFSKISSCETS